MSDEQKIIVTAQDALNRGDWLKFCEITGLSEWSVNEGMDASETLSLTVTEYNDVFN